MCKYAKHTCILFKRGEKKLRHTLGRRPNTRGRGDAIKEKREEEKKKREMSLVNSHVDKGH